MFGDLCHHNDDSICQITAQDYHNKSLKIEHEMQKHSSLVSVKKFGLPMMGNGNISMITIFLSP